ncbi:sigma factor-like helix-turn-helix DNA-binding protein [Acetivibrio sp. MSJd-27]
MYYFAGYSIRNIADMYEISHQNISYAHIKALKKLREFLEAGNEK